MENKSKKHILNKVAGGKADFGSMASKAMDLGMNLGVNEFAKYANKEGNEELKKNVTTKLLGETERRKVTREPAFQFTTKKSIFD